MMNPSPGLQVPSKSRCDSFFEEFSGAVLFSFSFGAAQIGSLLDFELCPEPEFSFIGNLFIYAAFSHTEGFCDRAVQHLGNWQGWGG